MRLLPSNILRFVVLVPIAVHGPQCRVVLKGLPKRLVSRKSCCGAADARGCGSVIARKTPHHEGEEAPRQDDRPPVFSVRFGLRNDVVGARQKFLHAPLRYQCGDAAPDQPHDEEEHECRERS